MSKVPAVFTAFSAQRLRALTASSLLLVGCGTGDGGFTDDYEDGAELEQESYPLKLTGTATASSSETAAVGPNNAVDGNASTRWSSAFSDPQWLQVDLGTKKTITRVVLNWEAAYSANYSIQVSDDANTWTTLHTETNTKREVDDIAVNGSGRYVRMYSTRRGTVYGNSLYEFEVHSPDVSSPPPATVCTSNALSPTGGATASSVERAGYEAQFAIDTGSNYNTTRWASAFADPQWLRVDLGARRFVNRVALTWEAAMSSDYDIQVSDDGSTWTALRTERRTAAGLHDLTGLSGKGRYVRMYSRARATAWGNSLFDFKVYGDLNPDCGSSTTPTPIPTPPPPPAVVAIPAKIEAEKPARFYDTTEGNSGTSSCSSTNVDAETTSDTGGGCNVGWTAQGEYLEYDISTSSTANFDVTVRMAANTSGRTVRLLLDGNLVAGGTLTAPAAGWQVFSDVTVRGISITSGTDHKLRLVFDTGSVNVNWLNVQPATTSPPPTGGRDGCKRGIAYGGHSEADLRTLANGVSWWYNWSPRPESGVSSTYQSMGVEFVPMVWGNTKGTTNYIESAKTNIPSSGMRTLLGFNEPNFFAQSNLSAAQAAQLWPQLEEIARTKGITAIASPAVNYCGPSSSCHDTDPVRYLDAFFEACKSNPTGGCKVDYIAYHAYVCKLEWLTPKIELLYKYNKPIWLTEFACGDSSGITVDMQVAYVKQAVPWLEANTRIMRYAWFSGRTTAVPFANLLGSSGQLTTLGQAYLQEPHNENCPLKPYP